MAARHSTPLKGRSTPKAKNSKHSLAQRIAHDVIMIDEHLREARKQLKQAAEASQRLGGKIYWQIRAAERRR